MIQIFTITAPLPEGTDDAAAVAVLTAGYGNVMRKYPSLRNAVAEASEGVVTLRLTVSSRDRWDTQAKARKIASSLLERRLGVDLALAQLELIETVPNATRLTKAQGRNVENYRRKVSSPATPEDPS